MRPAAGAAARATPWRWPALLALAALLAVLPGCRGLAAVNDRLRRENMELRRQVEALSAQSQLRQAELERLRQELAQADPRRRTHIEGAAVPRLTSLRLGRYSGTLDREGDGRHDTLRLYLRTLDQEGRFLPVEGEARVRAVLLRSAQALQVVAEADFDPAALRAAYRSGFTGTHYSLEAPLEPPLSAGVERLTVQVSLTDAASGATIHRQEVLEVRPRRADGR